MAKYLSTDEAFAITTTANTSIPEVSPQTEKITQPEKTQTKPKAVKTKTSADKKSDTEQDELNINVRIPAELHRQLKITAACNCTNVKTLVANFITDGLKNYKTTY